MMTWKVESGGDIFGMYEEQGAMYNARVSLRRDTTAAFIAALTHNGTMIHLSEHVSRIEAKQALDEALQRAIWIRVVG